MHPVNLMPLRIAIVLLTSSLLVTGCSSSSSNPTDVQSPVENGVPSSDESTLLDNGGSGVDAEAINDTTDTTTDETNSTGGMTTTPETQEPITTTPLNPNPVVPDPMVQNITRVNFDIQVPTYQSNALQVGLTWGERNIAVGWVGDEFWSAFDDFPTDTEQLLTATFSDGNGDITLGSYEQLFRTGTNESQSIQITADQFDTDRWDSDGDGVSNLDEAIAGTDALESPSVLLFSETRDFRHDSIEVALTALEALAASAGIQTSRADDSAGLFTDINLANYDAVVWVMTSGDVLNADEQAAFENFIRSGGGYAGIHAASFTEYEWPWYGALVGAYFDRHPEIQSASQNVENNSHSSTAHLNATWTRTDEWYDYRTNPRAQVNVLLSLDEGSYSGGGMGEDHPSAWYHDYDGGRSWYTGGGHTEASYAEPDFRAHLLGGLRYAVGQDATANTN